MREQGLVCARFGCPAEGNDCESWAADPASDDGAVAKEHERDRGPEGVISHADCKDALVDGFRWETELRSEESALVDGRGDHVD